VTRLSNPAVPADLSSDGTAARMTPRVACALSFTLLTWSSAFAAIRIALQSFSPGALTLYRVATASATLWIAALVLGVARLPEKRDIPKLLLCGLLSAALYHTLLNYGQLTVEAGPASFLINTAPLFTALLARAILKEHLGRAGWLGFVVSFLGVALIVVARNDRLAFDPHALLVLGAALSYSGFIVLQKPLLERYNVVVLTAFVTTAGTLFALIFLPELLRDGAQAPWSRQALVVYLGAGPAGLGFLGWSYTQSKLTASRAVSYLYLAPVLATVIAWFWIGERPSPLALVGGGIVLTGVVIVQRFGRR
jgi:drug/metabolite transporter (DMT)-like permease